MALIDLTATELLQQLSRGRVTSVELTQAFLDQIAKYDGAVKAFLRVDPPAALARAEEIDRRRAAGQAAGATGRPARGRQGLALHQGRADHLRLADPGELPPSL